MTGGLQADIEAIARIDAVPTLLDVISRTTGMGLVAVSRVTSDRWVACAVKDDIAFGLQPGGELSLQTTICRQVSQTHEPVIIDNVADDRFYCSHPIPAMYGFQSYISVPIILADGSVFGTLCAIDRKPAKLATPETTGMFRLFAQLIAFHLNSLDRMVATEASLSDERETAALREQFVAVLGHDLRNPLASIDAGMQILARTKLDDRAALVTEMVRKSVTRMAGLVDDILDFAQGRLGGGLKLRRDLDQRLEPVLRQILGEMRTSWPDRIFEFSFDVSRNVDCDPGRIGQVFSNLLSNAVAYGAAGTPIRAYARTDQNIFELSVSNQGVPIPPATREKLFRPFTRGAINANQRGLGLGLYICTEIARAHGGSLDVSCPANETCFTFRLPLGSAG